MVKSKLGGQEMAVMVGKWQKFSELLLLKFLPFTYHHSNFLAANLDFTPFFTMAFWGPHLFLQFGCFGLDIYPHKNSQAVKK